LPGAVTENITVKRKRPKVLEEPSPRVPRPRRSELRTRARTAPLDLERDRAPALTAMPDAGAVAGKSENAGAARSRRATVSRTAHRLLPQAESEL
jgi:hypothetical protein